jgi:hypothetical protein
MTNSGRFSRIDSDKDSSSVSRSQGSGFGAALWNSVQMSVHTNSTFGSSSMQEDYEGLDKDSAEVRKT